eukprot:3598131-Amphidinium_carterae.1
MLIGHTTALTLNATLLSRENASFPVENFHNSTGDRVFVVVLGHGQSSRSAGLSSTLQSFYRQLGTHCGTFVPSKCRPRSRCTPSSRLSLSKKPFGTMRQPTSKHQRNHLQQHAAELSSLRSRLLSRHVTLSEGSKTTSTLKKVTSLHTPYFVDCCIIPLDGFLLLALSAPKALRTLIASSMCGIRGCLFQTCPPGVRSK